MHAEAVWREAQAALLDHLQRRDAGHALQRLARSVAHLLDRPCGLFAHAQPAGAVPWLGGAGADEALLRGAGQCLPLIHAGHEVGELRVMPRADGGAPKAALAADISPLTDAAAALIATWLEQQGLAAPASLTLTRSALREAGVFVWEWDIPSDVLGDIDEGALMLGYAPHQIGHIQADWTALIHPDDREQVEAAYQAHVRGDSPLYRTVYRARAADGQWRWLEERGRIVERDANGQPLRMYGTQADASVEKALEQARRDQLAAEAASAAKTRLLSHMSHELRTPLNAVLGFAQLLEMGRQPPLSDGQRRQVGQIRHAGEHLLAMIGDLLDVSLIESGRMSMQPAPQVLAPLLSDAMALVQAQAQAAGITLHLAPPPDGATVHADRTRLTQVLINLLANAIQYNRPAGSVTLSAELAADANTWCIAVQDTGLGIAPERMRQLFQPFNRLGREHGPVPGAGLGLSLSLSLVQAMGGTLQARSDGQGSRFEVRLPALPPGPAS
ncbi:MAG TPA: PAS domain-containing sensor histidine kinase [Ideonella sp.]|uniref:PAS domain-containing sensor histidine kinase n=1 Tax=Ideonella sp. TaxID=1929293 RepID=UPI002C089947|nr:PAS domain-containing sensor histidine kinase [Ideonella sp.]HSI52131.1 PAS domain-containing sensor histidine kinase [Ideonella sp.]